MMVALAKSKTIALLRQRMEALEQRPALAEDTRLANSEGALVGQVPKGVLNEVWSDHYSHAGATLGFSLGQACGLLTSERLAILWLGLSHEAQETGLPYGAGLCAFGVDPERLVIGRMKKIEDLLWAIEEGLACPAVAAVIADISRPSKTLDFTVSRRLNLKAQVSGASVFLMRYGQAREASAATFRWRVTPTLSAAMPFDARAPGGARWQVQLEKGQRLGSGARGREGWILGWTENGFAIEADRNDGTGVGAAAAVSGAVPATLGDRLSATA